MDDDLGHAEDVERLRQRLARCTSGRRLVRPQVARQAVGRAAGAPRQRPRASRPSAGAGTCRHRRQPDGASSAHQRAASPKRHSRVAVDWDAGTPSAARHRPGRAAGNGSGGAYSRSNQTTAGSASQPFVDAPCSAGRRTATISWSSSRFGPGVAECGHECTQLPTACRDGAVQRACIRNAGSTYESFQPPMLKIAASIAS